MSVPPAGQDVQAAFCTVLVDEWCRAGVTDVVVCPGSRSTPVLDALAVASDAGRARLHVVLDERSAAFFALGLGLSSGVPAPVVVTSGTAAAELHPAIVEAHQSGVPFIAVTADRPPELQDCGAPQVVDQVNLYGGAVRWAATPGVPEAGASGSWRSLASRSVAEACGGAHRPGPVHLNLAFREPLLGAATAMLGPASAAGPRAVSRLRQGRDGVAPWHRVSPPTEVLPPADVVRMLAEAGERGLIVAGAGAGSPEAVWELSRVTSWPVMADPSSGCRLPGAICAADALLRSHTVREWRPQVVLRLGAPWASRVVNEWLAELACPQVLVDRWGTWRAPDRLPGDVVMASPEGLCRAVAKAVEAVPKGAWARQWALAENVAQSAIDATLSSEGRLTEPGIARTLVRSAQYGSTLVVSSSMPVRDLEWWGRPREGLRVLANRGANGIDGVLSTAMGAAAGSRLAGSFATAGRGRDQSGGELQSRTVALLGDLAFLYDAGALLGAARRGLQLDVVVVDNNGGGIFNFLPQASEMPPERFERLWGTPHDIELVTLAGSYGVYAQEVTDSSRLGNAISRGGPESGVRVLVAKTARAANVTVHRRLHKAVEVAVMGLGQ